MTTGASSFRLVRSCLADSMFQVYQYISERTGMTVTIADVGGPLVCGFFCLATEAKDDDGLPHTLEHLVFMGSKSYPYKGILDLLANRCLASGTNAWTEQNHTCYTLSTAGSTGFLTLLPLYLDHILFPMLTKSQFMTEVHHVTGSGEDGGVVYCEMQEHETNMSEMTFRALQQDAFVEECGYRYETGGRLLNLRELTSLPRIRNYHQKFYHPNNMNIIVTGTISHEKLFQALESVENDIIENGLLNRAFERPWLMSVCPPRTVSSTRRIQCPSETESHGMVRILFNGPAMQDFDDFVALEILHTYLWDSPVSPLQRDFVEVPSPFCSKVKCKLLPHLGRSQIFTFREVPVAKLDLIEQRLLDLIRSIATRQESLDMTRISSLILRAVSRLICGFETAPHEMVSEILIDEFLHGQSDDYFETRLNERAILQRLHTEPPSFWLSVVKKYLYYQAPICVIGVPCSNKLAENCAKEKARIQDRIRVLGEDGLKTCSAALQNAVEENEKNVPPEELLNRYVVSSFDDIKFFPVCSTSNIDPQSAVVPGLPLSHLPFTMFYDDCQSNFVYMTLLVDTSKIPKELYPLLLLWKELLFESPVFQNGEIIPYDSVVKQLVSDVVSYKADLGISSHFQRLISIRFTVFPENYVKAVQWLSSVVRQTQFQADRIRVVAQRLANSATGRKREGRVMARLLSDHLLLEKNSVPYLFNVVRLEKYLRKLLRQLDFNSQTMINDLNKVRECLRNVGAFYLHMASNNKALLEASNSPMTDLLNAFNDGYLTGQNRATIDPRKEPTFVKPIDALGRSGILAVGSCESAYLLHTTVIDIDYGSEDFPSLEVLIQYLCQTEGPLWKAIRGHGLAYGVMLEISVETKTVELVLYATSQPAEAFQKAWLVVSELVTGSHKISVKLFEAAKRSLIFEMVNREAVVSDAVEQTLLARFRGVVPDFNRRFCHKIWEVQRETLPAMAAKYILPMFDPHRSCTAITCNPCRMDSIMKSFESCGRVLEVFHLNDGELSF